MCQFVGSSPLTSTLVRLTAWRVRRGLQIAVLFGRPTVLAVVLVLAKIVNLIVFPDLFFDCEFVVD